MATETAQKTWDAEDPVAAEASPRLYELGFHLVPTTPSDALAGEVTRLKDRIAAYGGTCTAEQAPQRVELAYPIEQRRRHGGSKHEFETAYFGWLACELTPEAADALGHELRNDTGVLRHILVQTTQAEVEHSKERAVGDEHTASADSTDEDADADGAEVGADEDSAASSAHA